MRVFYTNNRGGTFVYQDEDETLDYVLDWADWLRGDTIATVTNEVSGLTLTSESNTGTTNTIWISGTDGYVTTTVTTSAGRTKQKTISFKAKVA